MLDWLVLGSAKAVPSQHPKNMGQTLHL